MYAVLSSVMPRNPGVYVELSDGRKGIAYANKQIHKDRICVSLINADFSPVISEKTNKQSIVFKNVSEVKIIGYCD